MLIHSYSALVTLDYVTSKESIKRVNWHNIYMLMPLTTIQGGNHG